MLSIIDIIRALSELVKTNFPNYPVNDRDVEEGFARPSYFIDTDNIKSEMTTVQYVKETAEIQLYFFAESRYEGFLELLEMKNQLLTLLTAPLALKDEAGKETLAHVVFNDITIEITKADMAMSCTMSSELIQALPDADEDLPYIENLVYDNQLQNEEV